MFPKGTLLFNTFFKTCISEDDKHSHIFQTMTYKTSTSTTILKTLQNFNNHHVHLPEALNISICLRYGCLLYSSNLDIGISEDLDRKQVAQSNRVIQDSLTKVVFKRVNGENYQGMRQCPSFLLLGLNEQEKETITRTQTVRVVW